MSLYHAVLFLYQRKEKVYLAFSLVCLFASLRFMMETNSFADLFIRGGIGMGLTRAYLMFFVLHISSIVFFAHAAFSTAVKGKIQRGVYAAAFVVAVAVALSVKQLILLDVIMIPLIWSTIDAARSGRVRENPYNALFVAALVIFIVWYPINVYLLDDALFVPEVTSNLFLVLSQCVMLSASYAETKRREEELARRTDFYHQMAHDLLTPLTVASTSIQLVKTSPENAKLLEKSQAAIMKMAGMVHTALREGNRKE
jgi:signal transduction histidine kinase